ARLQSARGYLLDAVTPSHALWLAYRPESSSPPYTHTPQHRQGSADGAGSCTGPTAYGAEFFRPETPAGLSGRMWPCARPTLIAISGSESLSVQSGRERRRKDETSSRRRRSARLAHAVGILAKQCVQLRLACSVGVSPTGGRVRTFVAWVASVEETNRMKPTDEAIFGMASESPGRNVSEPSGGLEKNMTPEAEPSASGRRQHDGPR